MKCTAEKSNNQQKSHYSVKNGLQYFSLRLVLDKITV